MTFTFVAATLIGALPISSCGKKQVSEQQLFEQALQFEGKQDYRKALECYQTIDREYSASLNRFKAIFMIGYIQMDYLKDNKKAVEAFDRLLKEYPDCELADDARIMRDAASSGRDLMSVFQDSIRAK